MPNHDDFEAALEDALRSNETPNASPEISLVEILDAVISETDRALKELYEVRDFVAGHDEGNLIPQSVLDMLKATYHPYFMQSRQRSLFR